MSAILAAAPIFLPALTGARLQDMDTSYVAHPDRYTDTDYRRLGESGLRLPAVSLGLWQNFGGSTSFDHQREILRRAFDLGVTHFDLANNYGPPYGAAETNFGRHFQADFRAHRDEMVLSTKAGWDMWPGPYGDGGSRKYLIASLDQSLRRLGVDYVDIYYSHRPDPATPLEETMGALATAVTSGKALYVGISSYSPERTRQAAAILRDMGVPLTVHQPPYSLLNRFIEDELLDTLGEIGAGCVVYSPLAQGLLTDRYLNGIPEGSRASRKGTLKADLITDAARAALGSLNDIAAARGQSLAQMALAWALRDQRVTSVLAGASSLQQLEANVAAVDNLSFSTSELADIHAAAQATGINLFHPHHSG